MQGIDPGMTESRVRDLGLYVLISLLVAAPPLAALWLDLPWATFMHWYGFACFTCLVFGQVIAKSRFAWRAKSFWVLMVIWLALHVGVFMELTERGVNLPGVDWMAFVVIELALFVAVRMWLYRKPRTRDRRLANKLPYGQGRDSRLSRRSDKAG